MLKQRTTLGRLATLENKNIDRYASPETRKKRRLCEIEKTNASFSTGKTPSELVPLRFIRLVRTHLNQFGLIDTLGIWKRKKTTRSVGRYREHVEPTPPYGDGTVKRRIVDVFSVRV